MSKTITITGVEANILLFGFDRMFLTNREGKIQVGFPGYKDEDIQSLRDRLFAAHEHPLGPQAKAAEQRPANFDQLGAADQWRIDKALGILDWDGDPTT